MPVEDMFLFPSKSFSLAFDEIMEVLKDDAVRMIAVWGMAGVGKTTLVRKVEERARVAELFDQVSTAVVSETLNLEETQDRAEQLWLTWKNEKRSLIILDGVWNEDSLRAIGIPSAQDHKGCKVLLTTRSKQVCKSMGIQKVIPLDILSDDEAYSLLKIKAGYLSDSAPPAITDVAIEVAKECQGLTIAIVELGRWLRGKPLSVWKITSLKLRSSRFVDGECSKALEYTYQCIRLSFSHLRNRSAEICLLCSLFPLDYPIDVELLTRYAWGLGLYEGNDSIKKVRHQVWTAIKDLRSFCLLLGHGETSVTMHNLVRHSALWIASQEKFSFMIGPEIGLKEWQKFEDLPEGFACEDLEILSLDGNGCRTIPSALLEGMKSLKVFTLRDGHLSASALENLTNLRTLQLLCCQVDDISSLGNIETLEILSFRGSDITKLPDEIGGLENLKLLDLFDCQKLQKVSPKLISKLCQLEELHSNDRSFEELPNLQTSEITIEEGGSFNGHRSPTSTTISPDKLMDPTVECLHLNHFMGKQCAVGCAKDLMDEDSHKLIQILKVVTIKDVLKLTSVFSFYLAEKLVSLEKLGIYGCHALKQIITETYARCFPKLISIEISNCDALEYVLQITTALFTPQLRVLKISGCPRLNGVIQARGKHIELPQLKTLEITDCKLLEYVFGNTTASFAPHLKELYISGCPRLNGVIQVGEKHIELPQLQTLKIGDCDSLKYVFGIATSSFAPHLKELYVSRCRRLGRVIQVGDHKHIKLPELITLEITHCSSLSEYVLRITTPTFVPKLTSLNISHCPRLNRILEFEEKYFSSMNFFHQLKRLALKSLDRLGTFCSEKFTLELPSLEELDVESCPKLFSICKTIASSKLKNLILFNVSNRLCEEIIKLEGGYFLSSLEKLMLQAMEELTWKDFSQIVTLQNLTRLKVVKCNKLKNILSMVLARNLLQLSHLEVQGCEELEQVVAQDRNSSSSLAGSKPECLPKLEELCIMECNKLRSLFPVSVCGLNKLKKLQVKGASNLRELFEHDSEANMTNDGKQKEVSLPKLEVLFLEDLPKLIRFSTVGYHFLFPSLISLRIKKCPLKKLQFTFNDDWDHSYVRADVKLLEDSNLHRAITLQKIEPKADRDENIEWDHPRRNLQTIDATVQDLSDQGELDQDQRQHFDDGKDFPTDMANEGGIMAKPTLPEKTEQKVQLRNVEAETNKGGIMAKPTLPEKTEQKVQQRNVEAETNKASPSQQEDRRAPPTAAPKRHYNKHNGFRPLFVGMQPSQMGPPVQTRVVEDPSADTRVSKEHLPNTSVTPFQDFGSDAQDVNTSRATTSLLTICNSDPYAVRNEQALKAYNEFKLSSSKRDVGLEWHVDKKFFEDFENKDICLDNGHIDAYMCYLSKTIKSGINVWSEARKFCLVNSTFFSYLQKEFENEFDPKTLESFECPESLLDYVRGNSPPWAKPWWDVDHVLLVCHIGGNHWITCNISLKDWIITIYDSLAHKGLDGGGKREGEIMVLGRLVPPMLQQAGYFDKLHIPPRLEMLRAFRLPHTEVSGQEDSVSCGPFCLAFLECIVGNLSIPDTIDQSYIPEFRKLASLKIFAHGQEIKTKKR